MTRALAGGLVACLTLGSAPPSAAEPAPPAPLHVDSAYFRIDATLVAVDLASKQITYTVADTAALKTGRLTGASITEASQLKAGQRVTLQCRSTADSADPLVESIRKKGSHKKLAVILGVVVVSSVVLVSSGGW